MPSFSDDLLVRLINHRVSDRMARREDYLTECFSWLLRHDSDLRAVFLGRRGPVLRGRREPRPIDVATAKIQTQVPLSSGARPDIEISDAHGGLLLVECKVDAPFDASQIERYLLELGARGQGAVVAITPGWGLPRAPVPRDERFLGIVCWEQVAEQVRDLPMAHDERDLIRSWVLRLLREFGLVTQPAEFAVDDEGGRVLAGALDEAVRRVGEDTELMVKAPEAYRLGHGQPRLHHSTLVSGKGEAPRPLLCHSAGLLPRHHVRGGADFATFSLVTYFRPPADLPYGPEPKVGLYLYTYPFLGKAMKRKGAFLAKLFELGGVATIENPKTIEKDAARLHEQWIRRAEGWMVRLGARLADGAFPGARDAQPIRSGSWIWLPLARTADLCPVEAGRSDVQERYETWLRAVLQAFFEAGPQELLDSYLAGAVMLRVRRPVG